MIKLVLCSVIVAESSTPEGKPESKPEGNPESKPADEPESKPETKPGSQALEIETVKTSMFV
jgi:hypothetical protein